MKKNIPIILILIIMLCCCSGGIGSNKNESTSSQKSVFAVGKPQQRPVQVIATTQTSRVMSINNLLKTYGSSFWVDKVQIKEKGKVSLWIQFQEVVVELLPDIWVPCGEDGNSGCLTEMRRGHLFVTSETDLSTRSFWDAFDTAQFPENVTDVSIFPGQAFISQDIQMRPELIVVPDVSPSTSYMKNSGLLNNQQLEVWNIITVGDYPGYWLFLSDGSVVRADKYRVNLAQDFDKSAIGGKFYFHYEYNTLDDEYRFVNLSDKPRNEEDDSRIMKLVDHLYDLESPKSWDEREEKYVMTYGPITGCNSLLVFKNSMEPSSQKEITTLCGTDLIQLGYSK